MKTTKSLIPGIFTLLGMYIGINQRISRFKFREDLSVHPIPERPVETLAPAETERPAPFTVEVMVSAGPRKGANEYETNPAGAELCEDCAGSALIGETVAGWLSDGASGDRSLPRLRNAEGKAGDVLQGLGFSSRALAKDLGQAFVAHAAAALQTGGGVPPTLAETAIAELATQWEKRLNAYLCLVEKRGLADRLLSQLPDTLTLEWSATFTGCIFHPGTRQLIVWNCGNAGGLVTASPPQVISPNTAYVTFAAVLSRETPLRSRLALWPLTDMSYHHFANASGFALMSDGMERYRLTDLLNRLRDVPINSLTEFRLELLKKADLTWDDKSLVFGRFLEARPCVSSFQTGAETKRSSLIRTGTAG